MSKEMSTNDRILVETIRGKPGPIEAVPTTTPTLSLIGRPVNRINLHNGVPVGVGNHAKIQKTILSATAPDETHPKPTGWASALSMQVTNVGIYVIFPSHEKLIPFANVYDADLAPA